MAGEHGPVEVRLSTCECPGEPHTDGDVVWLRAKPDLDMGLAAQVALRESGHNRGDAEGSLVSAMVRYGVVAWTCRNEEGPIRPSPDAVVERLGWSPDTLTVANEARRLYMDALLAPLVPAPSEPLQPSQAADSTSASPASSPHYPEFVRAVLALRCGGWEIVRDDWRVALTALQIIAEQGPGQLMAEAEAQENAAMSRLRKLVH